MPVIKSAIKKLRQDRKHEKQNNIVRDALRKALKNTKKTKSGKSVSIAISTIDKAVKNNIIHKNKASRLKSSLAKLSKPTSIKTGQKESKKPKKTSSKKISKKSK